MPASAGTKEVAAARAALMRVEPPDAAAVEAVCGAALALGVTSMRAPRLALRAAAALAALEDREAIDADDLATAARLVLAPRATRRPDRSAEAEAPEQATGEAEQQPSGAEDGETPSDLDQESAPGLDDVVLDAALASLPDALSALWTARGEAARSAPRSAGQGGAKRADPRRGRRIGARAGLPREAAQLDVVETIKAAAPWQAVRVGADGRGGGGLRLRRDDFRVRRFEQRAESTVIFVVDASGSSALQRLAEAKGAVELLLGEAYVGRRQVALIAFRGTTAETLLPPTRSLTRARRALAELAGGGATPLAAALEAGAATALAERAKGRTPFLVVLTDGRGNVALDGAAFRTRAETDALAAARRIRAAGVHAALIDISPRPRGEGAKVAEAMAALFAALPYVEAGAVREVVRALDPGGRG